MILGTKEYRPIRYLKDSQGAKNLEVLYSSKHMRDSDSETDFVSRRSDVGSPVNVVELTEDHFLFHT